MRRLFLLETQSTFEVAAGRAKELANRMSEPTFVRPHGTNWAVISATVPVPKYELSRGTEHHPTSDHGEHMLLMEELTDYEDGYARSDEEGWFYPDDERLT